MPDTPANQKEYPQQPSQKPGLGFPIIRLVGLISLSCGAILDVAMAAYCGKQTGETALLRQLLGVLQAGDVLKAVATHRVNDRPDRVEPRAVKRRPKKLTYLTVPRSVAVARLLKGI